VPGQDGSLVDLSRVPAAGSHRREFVYVRDLPEGWCGIQRGNSGERIIVTFPHAVFPYCWLFMPYGGWRDYYTVVLEPCTNMPKDLGQAMQLGQSAKLAGHGVLDCAVQVSLKDADG
jgi:hypothetical protein